MARFVKLDLDQWEPPEGPAKSAKVANLPVRHPDQRQKLAGLATLADLPGDVVDGVRRLKVMHPPRLLRPDAWSIVVADAALLVESGWAASALKSGWSTVEIFGAVPDLAGDPASDGLAVWLAGRKLRMITAERAVVENGPYVKQLEAMQQLKGRKVSRQKITVRNERHVHHHQHVHVEGGQQIVEPNPMKPTNPGLLAIAQAPRCLAKTRQGTSCRCAVMRGRSRCHKHGGAKGSGAPMGEANGAWQHGGWTKEAVALRRQATRLLKTLRAEEVAT